jgi:hypothetical protein
MNIDINRYIDSEEDIETHGERIYLSASRLIEDIVFELKNDPDNKDIEIEVDIYND